MPATARGISPNVSESIPRESAKGYRDPIRGLARFVEKDDEDLSFDEDIRDAIRTHPPAVLRTEFRLLPGTASLTSPTRRRSLSEFSEDTDTDITEINDEDFEEIDDIFGKEESGIYNSDGTRVSKKTAGPTRAREVLIQRKQQMEEQARAEDDELYRRYTNSHTEHNNNELLDPAADEVNTLKLKDLRLYGHLPLRQQKDHLQNDATIDYEYTKDDFETFEDGFADVLPSMICQDKLLHFHTKPVAPSGDLLRKASMPVFPRSLKASKPTKFKSSMDLAGTLRAKPSEHPLFNHNNKIIRKLDRMPSFHIKRNQQPPSESREDLLDYNMELRKKQLLEKYMEISEKQFQLRSSPTKSSGTKHHDKPPRKGVGIVKYLNHRSAVPSLTGNKQMKFNLNSKLWEGNEHDLLRFDENKDDGPSHKKQKQPSLITVDQFRHQKDTVKGNMVYDPENLRWVNKDAIDEQQENVFDDLPDLTPNDIPQYATTEPVQSKPTLYNRGVSAFTQRTFLNNSTGSTAVSNSTAGEEFVLSLKHMAKFEKEEMKIRRKTHNWFGPSESYHLSSRSNFDFEYFWEIRKMVMDNDA
ncbi:hypothetical protein METBIDRAFT_38584 [Metschnikowia bicuspidata var. bicuspidata NRRL YB-4993]|uniref:Uncharacterized protein n=1 Tax=Metschnikowia bicuspidata var. bicuspidata NRRL YB-4993 TaxID=869754 RepID=A0A1A0HJR9_9ASCO|nr:hypothetical protein METBIDRAFT_38584 [Metschnikowia bicuspidata var. bicuspidata NRRL YB-4993]OBA24419.1 hypothetical protein METBIDRAFT_38584 [Metschnikowia bicuspidata var. bicuspidata NRRL YB-4993]